MRRILITGYPRSGKSQFGYALASITGYPIYPTDFWIGTCSWSEQSQRVSEWFDQPGPWIIEGVTVPRALRKWRRTHPGEHPPCDVIIVVRRPIETLKLFGQQQMAREIENTLTGQDSWLRYAPYYEIGPRKEEIKLNADVD